MLAPLSRPLLDLSHKKGLVIGIANAQSLAWGAARAFRAAGAELAVTYLNAKAEPHVRPLAEALEAPLVLPLDYRDPAALEAVFAAISAQWGRLDFVLHAVAFAARDDLYGRVTDCSPEGFAEAMDLSCHSFLRTAHLAEPLMTAGGALLTLSFLGATRVVPNYNLMGPVKAALEGVVRTLAVELGPQRIRVNAIAPGPTPTRAAGGLPHFDNMLATARARAPLGETAGIEEVGALAAFLAGDSARLITGAVIPVDGGLHVVA